MKKQVQQIEQLSQYHTVSDISQKQYPEQNTKNTFKSDKLTVRLEIQNNNACVNQKSLQIEGQLIFVVKEDIPNDLSVDLDGIFTLQIVQNQGLDNDLSTIKLQNQKLVVSQIQITQESLCQNLQSKLNKKQVIKNRNKPQASKQYFLDCSQQLYQLDQFGKPLKYLKCHKISELRQNNLRRIQRQEKTQNQRHIRLTDSNEFMNFYSYPFKFEVPGQFPPSLNPLRFDDLELKVFYLLTARNSCFSHSWNIQVKKTVLKHKDQQLDIKEEKEIQQQKINCDQKDIKITPFIANLDQASKRELNIDYSCAEQILANQLTFKLYRYCFCSIGQFTIQATVKIPRLNNCIDVIDQHLNSNIYLRLQLYCKDSRKSDQQILQLISQIEISLVGELKGFREKVFIQKTLTLVQQQQSPGGLYSQIVLDLNRNELPASQKNQLFTLKYFLEVQPVIKVYRCKETFIHKRQIII